MLATVVPLMLVKNKQPRSHSCAAALVMKWLKRWRLPTSVSDTNLTGGQTKTQRVCTVGRARKKLNIFMNFLKTFELATSELITQTKQQKVFRLLGYYAA